MEVKGVSYVASPALTSMWTEKDVKMWASRFFDPQKLIQLNAEAADNLLICS
jgi:hypothetical protein